MNRVVVTGMGVVTPVGNTVDDFWDSLIAGRSGAAPISSFDASDYPVRFAAEVKSFDPSAFLSPREGVRLDRYAQMAVVAAGQAWTESGLAVEDTHRAGVVFGSGIGGLRTVVDEHTALLEHGPRGVSPFMVPKLMPNGAAAAIAMRFGLHGPNFAVASACATGAHAIGEAFRCVRTGLVDAMIAGGSEAGLTPLALAAFARMGALSKRNEDPTAASRPFDVHRDGFVFGEGAGALVLESEDSALGRGAGILGEIAGYGASCDAHHATQPDPEGRGAFAAMSAALADAGLAPHVVDHINAHGTSTPFNDRIESLAIKSLLGVEAKRIPVVSTKSQTGHLLGAAGAVEAVATLSAMRAGVIPATINLTDPDPDCDLDHVIDEPRDQMVDVALSNSFGFGGQNASLVFRGYR